MNKIVLLVLIIITVSCGSYKKQEIPDRMVFGFITADDPQGTMAYHIVLANYLKKELNLKKVTLFTSTDYATLL